jgi:hypothetical protein
MEKINFEPITLHKEISSRGGGIEIDLTSLGYKLFKGHKMTAYQNYLGGGMLGKVSSDCTLICGGKELAALIEIAEQLKEYFFYLTNPEEGFESQSYVVNQHMPISAY